MGRTLTPLLVALGLTTLPPARAADAPRPAALEAAMERLSTLHVLRGLQLEPAQLAALTDLAAAAAHHRRAREATEAGPAEALTGAIDRYVDALVDGTVRDGLGNPLADQVYAGAGEDRARANAWLARLTGLEAQARRVLSPEQCRIVERFTRCVVAPAYLADPERIGEAGKASDGLLQLREIRAMDPGAWAARREAWMEDWLRGVEGEVGPLGAARRRELGDRLALVLTEARRLDRLAFALRGRELAAFLDFEAQEQEHLRDLAGAIGSRQGGPGPIARWLLSDAARDLYPRLAAARPPVLPDGPLPAIPLCTKGGSCATTTFASLMGRPPAPAGTP